MLLRKNLTLDEKDVSEWHFTGNENSYILIVMLILKVLRIHPARTSEPTVPDLNIFQTFDQRLYRSFPLCISVLMR